MTARSLLLAVVVAAAGCGPAATSSLPSTTAPAAATTSTPTVPSTPFTPAPPGRCRYVQPQTMPDPACTPGQVNPAVTQQDLQATICRAGWTATVRPPAGYTDGLKARQMAVYGLAGPASSYEEDHRVPLEVGGNPTAPANLWPEPWAGAYGAHAKDAIENRVRRQVCAGTLTLAQGQAVFLGDWWTATP